MTSPANSPTKGIVIFGSGRWARVYINIVHTIYPSYHIFVRTSDHWLSSLQAWIDSIGLRRYVTVVEDLDCIDFSCILFALVVNKASSHYASALYCLSRGCHVAIEKPICLVQPEYDHLVSVAHSKGLVLFPLLVFAFHPSIHLFFSLFPPSSLTELSLDFIWCDQASGVRHGGHQNFDTSIPSYLDVLPHVFSIISLLEPSKLPTSLAIIDSLSDYSSVDISLSGANFSSHIAIRRGSNIDRVRVVNASTGNWKASLDFTAEPGFIKAQHLSTSDYIKCPSWVDTHTPLIRQLNHFAEIISTSSASSMFFVLHGSVNNFFSLISGIM